MKGQLQRRGKKGSKKRKAKKPISNLTAANADLHDLYQRAVQDPDFEIEFLNRAYREIRNKEPRHLREDFCGTAFTTSRWVTQGDDYTAEGFDLDQSTLDWGREQNVQPLGAQAERVNLVRGDVRDPAVIPADIRSAQNFSYQVFHTRTELLEYFRAVYAGLADDGIFVMDMYGGSEAVEPLEEERWIDDEFIYVWDQDEHWPGTGEHKCYIHFRFEDGSEILRAFQYDWRLWSMPEAKELLAEAGFKRVISYFEEFDDEGDGSGEYKVNERGFPCESWLAYIVAAK